MTVLIYRRRMKIYIVILVLFILAICINSLALCGATKSIAKQELFVIYSDKLKILNLFNIDRDKIKYESFNIGVETEWYGKKVWNVACLHSGIVMDIDYVDGTIRGLSNRYITDIISGVGAPVFEGGSKPKEKREFIIKEAEKYIQIINGEIPKDAYYEKAIYDNNSSGIDTKRYYEGLWRVDWGRKTGGYKYRFDGIRVTIHEKYGLAGYGYVFFSDPPDSLIVNISKEKAIGIAKPFAKKMARLFGYKSGEALDAELQITNPNYFEGQFAKGFSKIGVKDYSKYPQSYTRLAWIVSFSWGYDEIFTKNYDPAHVWIDAETGEILGGGS